MRERNHPETRFCALLQRLNASASCCFGKRNEMARSIVRSSRETNNAMLNTKIVETMPPSTAKRPFSTPEAMLVAFLFSVSTRLCTSENATSPSPLSGGEMLLKYSGKRSEKRWSSVLKNGAPALFRALSRVFQQHFSSAQRARTRGILRRAEPGRYAEQECYEHRLGSAERSFCGARRHCFHYFRIEHGIVRFPRRTHDGTGHLISFSETARSARIQSLEKSAKTRLGVVSFPHNQFIIRRPSDIFHSFDF